MNLLFFILTFFTPISQAQSDSPMQLSFVETEKSQYIESEKNTMEVFKSSAPMVVSVDSTRMSNHIFSSHGFAQEEVPAGSGSGFVWDDKGHVITNFHVIQGALNGSSQIWVSTKNGERHKAIIVGQEPRKDIAVLKVSGLEVKSGGFSEKIAKSNELQVGQKVLAIGNPFGFEHSLTTGIVSALDRSMPSVMTSVSIRNMIQTDASINPGNSGGPLLDSRGFLVGMNTAIISGSGSSAGIGFAVPSNTIKNMVEQILEYGEVRQAGIGVVSLTGYRKMMLGRYGYDVNDGVVIESVENGGPAAKAGLRGLQEDPRVGIRIGDVITAVNNKKVKNYDDLYNILSEKKVGETVKIEYRRMGRILSKDITLELIKVKS